MYIHEHTPEMNGCVSPDFNLRGDRYRKLMGFKSGKSLLPIMLISMVDEAATAEMIVFVFLPG